ncbi:MAG: hypothetical protein ACKOTZ_08700, partial [Chloroflexota bacterium]
MRRGPIRQVVAAGLLATLVAVPAVPPVGAAAASDAEPVVPRFAEVTRSAGVRHVYDGEWEYFVGGGVAAFDCSGDGLPEL